MAVLILGGSGFLGRYLVKYLIKQNYSVVVLTRNPQKLDIVSEQLSVIEGDLLKYESLDFSNYTHIINCSGEIRNEALMQALHVDCVTGILNKLQHHKNIHWIQVSSVGVYGKISSGTISEGHPFAPVGTYEITKAKGELLVKQLCEQYHIDYTIIRPSNVFGLNMPNTSLEQLITLIKKRLFFYIGKKEDIIMTYVPVEDVVHLIALCLQNPNAKNQEFNISDQLPLVELVRLVCYEFKIKNQFFTLPKHLVKTLAFFSSYIPKIPLTPSRVDALTSSAQYVNTKIEQDLNYQPCLGVTEGLKQYIEHMNHNTQ